ncbi:histidine phosphatase family protein [Niabella insulamsoli]|uniref:histidine phosphatase family protein n=1 Tax=Niabella insulamsoli TaxID=3144874 RepID=UPI0031FDC5CF
MKAILFLVLLLGFNEKLLAQQPPSQKITFYIVRHGETLLNKLHRVQGWADAPLTANGTKVTKALAHGLKHIGFKAAYSSDLGRAKETAGYILQLQNDTTLTLSETPALRESCFGSYEGSENKTMWTDAALYLHYVSVEALFADMQKPNRLPDVLAAIKELDTLKIAEDFKDVATRMKNWIIKTANSSIEEGGNVLVVSHGIAINALLSVLTKDHFVHQPLANASVTKVEYENGKFTIRSVGDMKYVEAGLKAVE